MESEKSSNLLSKAKGLKTKKNNGVSPSVSAEEDWWSSLVRQRVNSFCLYLLVLFRPSTDWMMPTYMGEDNLLYVVYRFTY